MNDTINTSATTAAACAIANVRRYSNDLAVFLGKDHAPLPRDEEPEHDCRDEGTHAGSHRQEHIESGRRELEHHRESQRGERHADHGGFRPTCPRLELVQTESQGEVDDDRHDEVHDFEMPNRTPR